MFVKCFYLTTIYLFVFKNIHDDIYGYMTIHEYETNEWIKMDIVQRYLF